MLKNVVDLSSTTVYNYVYQQRGNKQNDKISNRNADQEDSKRSAKWKDVFNQIVKARLEIDIDE